MTVKGRVVKIWVVNKSNNGVKTAPHLPDEYLIPVVTDVNLVQVAEVECE